MTKRINVFEMLGCDRAFSVEVADRLYTECNDELKTGSSVEVDFNGISVLPTSFVVLSIGKLMQEYDRKTLLEKLIFTKSEQDPIVRHALYHLYNPPRNPYEIPEWDSINGKKSEPGNELDPIEQFILDYEPVDGDKEFRDKLKDIIEHVANHPSAFFKDKALCHWTYVPAQFCGGFFYRPECNADSVTQTLPVICHECGKPVVEK